MGIVFKTKKIKIIAIAILLLLAVFYLFGRSFIYKMYIQNDEEGHLWFLYNLFFIVLFGIINSLISYLINPSWLTKILIIISIFNTLLFVLFFGYTAIYPQEKFKKLIGLILPYRSFFISPLPLLITVLLNFIKKKLHK